MDADQFAQFMDAVRMNRPSSKKVEPFSSGDGVEWVTWRSNFELTARINQWGDRRQRREIGASMTGAAKQFVADIAIGDEVPAGEAVAAAEELLDAYQDRFLPEAATDAARVAVREARMTEDETILAWHARLRSLYQRAHPTLDAAALEANVDLRDQFILGMTSEDIVSKVWHQRPATYGEALWMASNVGAGNSIIRQRFGGRAADAVKREPNVNAIAGPAGDGAVAKVGGPQGGCWECGGSHYARDCPGTGAGGRGRGRGRGRVAGRAGSAGPRRDRTGRGRSRARGPRGRGASRGGRRRINNLHEGVIGSIGEIFEDHDYEGDDGDYDRTTDWEEDAEEAGNY